MIRGIGLYGYSREELAVLEDLDDDRRPAAWVVLAGFMSEKSATFPG